MGISISAATARARLRAAVGLARSGVNLPDEWREVTQYLEMSPSKSYTPALATALLARATDERADALSIKEDYSDRTYSLRTLCHAVIVPGAHEYGFGLRAEGREPMNNQPFFRFDYMDTVPRERVLRSARPFFDRLVEACRAANDLTPDEALEALAAFLSVRLELRASAPTRHISDIGIGLSDLIRLVADFVREDETPARLQAVLAATLGCHSDDLVTRKLNDPSRDFPGDVQIMESGAPVLAAEARAKPVLESDVLSFAKALAEQRIQRGLVLATHQPEDSSHTQLLSRGIRTAWTVHRVLMRVFLSPGQLIREALMWSQGDLSDALAAIPPRLLRCLEEVGASDASLARWQQLCEDFEAAASD